jgi:hypothetical protein
MSWQLYPDRNGITPYIERIHADDEVYVFDDFNYIDLAKPIVKATVDSVGDRAGDVCLIKWPTINSGPDYGENGRCIYTSSMDVFTHDEALGIIRQRDPSLLQTADTVDELLVDETAGKEVAVLLGGACIERALDAWPIFMHEDYIARHGLSS